MTEFIRNLVWVEHLDEVYAWSIKNPNGDFHGMEELIKECPNKDVRDFFMGILDEWNQMRAERLQIVAEDYYLSRIDMLLEQAEAMIDYNGVYTLLGILEWYMTK